MNTKPASCHNAMTIRVATASRPMAEDLRLRAMPPQVERRGAVLKQERSGRSLDQIGL